MLPYGHIHTNVLLSIKDKKFYTGTTNNLKKRFEEHNNGKVRSTASRRPFKLIYCEACICKEDAFRREKYLKSGKPASELWRERETILSPLNKQKFKRECFDRQVEV